MTIGLSTYALFWQWHETATRPLDPTGLIDKAAALGVELLQICDFSAIERCTDEELRSIRNRAENHGLALELGTRGVRPAHLRRYLHLADLLGVVLIRSMINSPAGQPDEPTAHQPSADEAVALLGELVPELDAAGVTIALETYEQVPVATLIDIVRRIDSDRVGICLDPGNSVAALEMPAATVTTTAPYVKNLHVKDFAFTRRDGWIGFTYAGAKLGEGQLDYDAMIEVIRPEERGINQIIEHWLPWQGDSATTIALEDEWARHSITYLRSKQS